MGEMVDDEPATAMPDAVWFAGATGELRGSYCLPSCLFKLFLTWVVPSSAVGRFGSCLAWLGAGLGALGIVLVPGWLSQNMQR